MIGWKYKFKSYNYLHNPPRQVRFLYFPPKAWVWSSNLQRRTNGKNLLWANLQVTFLTPFCNYQLPCLLSVSVKWGNLNMAGCRSGHNGLDLKSCVSARIRPVGSNPTPAASAYISLGLEMI